MLIIRLSPCHKGIWLTKLVAFKKLNIKQIITGNEIKRFDLISIVSSSLFLPIN